MLARLRRLPLELRIALLAMIAGIIVNLLWALSLWGAKVDPGLATLFGAVIGLAIVGQQARKGFGNLIRSQANQAEIDRQARLHQVEIDRIKQTEDNRNKLNTLANALWAEVFALYFQVQDLWVANRMFAKVHEEMAKRRTPPYAKSIAFPVFDAPVYKANIQNLGLLPVSIAADVILVMTRASGGENRKFDQENPISHDLAETLHRGFADTLGNWSDDLLHVSNRLSSVVLPNTPDPGTLYDAQKRREKAKKASNSKPS